MLLQRYIADQEIRTLLFDRIIMSSKVDSFVYSTYVCNISVVFVIVYIIICMPYLLQQAKQS